MSAKPANIQERATNLSVQEQSGRSISLSELSGGARCRITSMDLQPSDTQLLHAMGLTDRCELCICQPGEPCIVRVNQTRLGIAGSLARKILVCQIDE